MEKVGPRRLNDASIAALGYPAVLAVEQYEFQFIREKLGLTEPKETPLETILRIHGSPKP